MGGTVNCPRCGNRIVVYKNPVPTVDILVAHPARGVVLVERRFEPVGWALPGGFVNYGESAEAAALREAFEETSLRVRLTDLLGVYSDPARDKRFHTISTVFIAQADDPDALQGGDDAARACFFALHALPDVIAFDHRAMLRDFIERHARRYGFHEI